MVSGFVTSPCDQLRIFSGLARRILIESKSITTRPTSTLGRIGIIRLIRYYLGKIGRVRARNHPPARFALPPRWRARSRAPRARPGVRRAVRRFFEASMLGLDQLNVQAQALQLPDEDVEGFRQAGREHGVALDDGLVDLGAAVDVVRLGGQELLEDVRGSVRLQRPHLHLPEPLSAELRLAAQRLLGDQ